LNNQN